jgi:uncharacterized protein
MNAFQLIRLGQVERLEERLSDNQLFSMNEEGQNLLHEAVAYNQIKIGEILIREGIEINHRDKSGSTPLHYAAIHRNPAFAKLLLENGADPNLIDEHGNGPLWAAVFNAKGSYSVVEMLLNAGADPTHPNHHAKSPIDFAAQIKDSALQSLLTQRAA